MKMAPGFSLNGPYCRTLLLGGPGVELVQGSLDVGFGKRHSRRSGTSQKGNGIVFHGIKMDHSSRFFPSA